MSKMTTLKKSNLSNECKILIKRLKNWDEEKISRNPSLIVTYYPVRNPDSETTIFDEVYTLVDYHILRQSYRSRIFLFLTTCLSSTNVPAYVIAAYIKKLSRITLIAKSKTLILILKLVENLFIGHPTLWFMRDRVDEKASELSTNTTVTLRHWLDNDPFDPEEVDPKATNAMDSYIWELIPLRFHEDPEVREAAAFLNENKPVARLDI